MSVSGNRRFEPRLLGFIVFVVVAILILPNGGIATQISSEYRSQAIGVAIGPVILIGWWFRAAIVGSTYRMRVGGMTEVGPAVSWFLGLFAATVIAFLAISAVALEMTRREGVAYSEIYDVTGKYENHGKNECYGLILTKEHDQSDRFSICVPQSEHSATEIGDRILINGIRSHYANEMLSFKAVSDARPNSPTPASKP